MSPEKAKVFLAEDSEPSPRAYYEEYLRRKHADWDDIQIERKAVLDLEDVDFRELIEMQLKWYRNLKKKHPDLDIDSWWWPGSEDSNEEAS